MASFRAICGRGAVYYNLQDSRKKKRKVQNVNFSNMDTAAATSDQQKRQ
jgi:hypothetical protein